MKIGIVGAGFVGLTFAAVLASKNYQVLVLDIDNKKLNKIKKGISPFFEPKLHAILKKTTKLSLQVTNDFKKLVEGFKLPNPEAGKNNKRNYEEFDCYLKSARFVKR